MKNFDWQPLLGPGCLSSVKSIAAGLNQRAGIMPL
jgi:hypothetical protein